MRLSFDDPRKDLAAVGRFVATYWVALLVLALVLAALYLFVPVHTLPALVPA